MSPFMQFVAGLKDDPQLVAAINYGLSKIDTLNDKQHDAAVIEAEREKQE